MLNLLSRPFDTQDSALAGVCCLISTDKKPGRLHRVHNIQFECTVNLYLLHEWSWVFFTPYPSVIAVSNLEDTAYAELMRLKQYLQIFLCRVRSPRRISSLLVYWNFAQMKG